MSTSGSSLSSGPSTRRSRYWAPFQQLPSFHSSSSLLAVALTSELPHSHQAGYFRLDDINAKLKEQIQHAEQLVQQERARVVELEQQCERLRRSGGTGLDPETAANADQIEQLTARLRQTERERDQALRQSAHGGSAVNNDGCFDPTPSGMAQRQLHLLFEPCCAVVLPWHD